MNEENFHRQILGEFPPLDREAQILLKAWCIYHRIRDYYDEKEKWASVNYSERTKLQLEAQDKAYREMDRFLYNNGIHPHEAERSDQWQWAKQEAVRLVEARRSV